MLIWILSTSIAVIAHEPDNRILECAMEGQADYIISGDKHLLDLKTYQGIKIVTLAEFLEIFEAQGKGE